MNINNTLLNPLYFYYPIGNTPPVCLTQDQPPELQDVDILMLGCGDVRHVLFTCFADNSRKIDVTCCDIEPIIHARNVLLYTLLIDDESNSNIKQIWNIYYHWKIDGNSLELLESQTQKLLQVSESVDQWHSSVYGSVIRFCDERSLSSVRRYWSGFTSRDLSPSQKEHRLSRLQAAIDRAKANRPTKDLKTLDGTGYRSTFPTAPSDEAWADLCKVSEEWWEYGMVPASNLSASQPAHLNPAFLYAPDYPLTLYFYMSSLGGIPLSNAYVSINKGSAFYAERKGVSSTERLVNCAKSHFTQWAVAFRRAVANKLVIRIFSGDALAFCFTLRNCQLTQSTSMNLFSHNCTSSPLILHDSDYGYSNNNAAPLSFDVIDTSNLIDFLGPLNLITLGSSLLKHHLSSCLYTELLIILEECPVDRLSTLLGADVRCMSLLLGLVPPDLFTNASNSLEEHRNVGTSTTKGKETMVQARSRLRWKRLHGSHESCISPPTQVEANELAKLLIQVHDAMFKLDDLSTTYSLETHNSRYRMELHKLYLRPYNRASFAFLLSVLKTNVISDWDKCLKLMYEGITSNKSFELVKINFVQDLGLYMHFFGVDSSMFSKVPPILNLAILASVLPKCEDPPDQLCVTVRVPRKHLGVFVKQTSALFIICSFEARDSRDEKCIYSFSSVQIAFGKRHEQTAEDDSYPFIEEDTAQMSGTSDMFVSVLVPTSLLSSMRLQSDFVPLVKCGLKYSLATLKDFVQQLGPDLFFSSSKLTGKNVFITRFMPGMRGLPAFNFASNQQEMSSCDATVAHLSDDGLKIKSLSKRITLESDAAKAKLATKSSAVKVEFKSPLTAVVSIAESFNFLLEFPFPVSVSNHKVKVARKSSYIEVESCLLDPLVEDAPSFLFPCFLTKVPSGIVPTPWTATYVDLDCMPSIDLDGSEGQFGSWVHTQATYMFSVREILRIECNARLNFRALLKQGLLDLFLLYAGSEGQGITRFGLYLNGRVRTLIWSSCLRLDLANNAVVLDCALIPLTSATEKNPPVTQFLGEFIKDGFSTIILTEAENCAWKAMMPALVERCRTWKHSSECEYVKTGEVPLSKGLSDDGLSPSCSCGIGKFPDGYLKNEEKRFPALRSILNQFATRVAISLIFAVPYVEDCNADRLPEKCEKCGSGKRKNPRADKQSLLVCSRCKMAKYCSTDCQKADWKDHKLFCKVK